MEKLGEKESSSTGVTVDDLTQRYGRPVQDKVLADWLERDVRTIRKHAPSLGGKEIVPGVFLFTLNGLDEVLLRSNDPSPVAIPANLAASETQKERPIQNQKGTPSPATGHSKGRGGKRNFVNKHGIWPGTNRKQQTNNKIKKVEEPVEGDVSTCAEGIG